jgi:asparagine synthase (glutamine-hydrolysing)
MASFGGMSSKLIGHARHLALLASDRNAYRVIRDVKGQKLTYLSTLALVELRQTIKELEHAERDGVLIEAGCALGGSALVVAASKSQSRDLYIYDVFDMIPPPSERDGADAHERYNVIVGGDSVGIRDSTYYGYQKNLLEQVQSSFLDFGYPPRENNIHLVQGLFEDTLAVNEPVLLAHIDSDWYDSVLTCLQRIEPQLVSGGVLIVDDYYTWSGCRAAVDDYFSDKRSQFTFADKSRLHISRR